MNSRLNYLYQKKSQVKKERDKDFSQLYYYSILPWLILGIGVIVEVSISFIFGLDWKGSVLRWLSLSTFILLVTFLWGVYWMFKIKKCSKRLDKIDEKIGKELSGSNF